MHEIKGLFIVLAILFVLATLAVIALSARKISPKPGMPAVPDHGQPLKRVVYRRGLAFAHNCNYTEDEVYESSQ